MAALNEKNSKKIELDFSGLKGARLAPFPTMFAPMLASPGENPASTSGWICEPKLDGIRGIACIRDGKTTLLSRRSLDLTRQYPVLSNTLSTMFPLDIVLDGEIIALNDAGQPSFQQLQQRMNLAKEIDVERAEKSVPVFYYIFDVLYADKHSLVSVPLRERKRILEALVGSNNQVKLLQHFEGNADLAYDACVEQGFEGIVAKRLESLYESGRRSPSWLKVKAQQTDEFVVGGYTAGQGSRGTSFGALLLGQFDESGAFLYCGSVGTGFDDKLLNQTMGLMQPLNIPKCPFKKRPDEKKQVVWIKPEIVIEAKFMDWTRDRHLRAPVFLRFRDDKTPMEVMLQPAAPLPGIRYLSDLPNEKVVEQAPRMPEQPVRNNHREIAKKVLGQLSGKDITFELIVGTETIKLTNLNRPFWPKTADRPEITKRDYLKFLTELSEYILPQMENRPLTVIRATDGVHKKHFYQKHWSHSLPEFVDTVVVQSEDADEEPVEHVICNNLSALLYFAQHSVVEFHTMPARISQAPDMVKSQHIESHHLLNFPDYIIFDLDVHKEGRGAKNPKIELDEFKQVCEVALSMRDLLHSMSLIAHCKTSGRTGLHIIVPIVRNLEFDIARSMAEMIGNFVVMQNQNVLTQNPVVAKTTGKILLDHSPNARGKTIASPYTPRTTLDAAVSTPVSWNELSTVSANSYTIHNLLERLADTGDIWSKLHAQKRDLQQVLNSISRK